MHGEIGLGSVEGCSYDFESANKPQAEDDWEAASLRLFGKAKRI
jgi:hypothetical protein